MKVTHSENGTSMEVSEETASRLGPEWQAVKEPAKKAPAKSTAKADDDSK